MSRLPRHVATFFGASLTRLGTFLTMRMRMVGAFGCARFANLRTQFAYRRGKLAAARHEPGGEPAERGTVDIERDAARHRLHVVFLQTCCGAMITGGRTVVTRFYAAGKFFMGHGMLLRRV